MYQYIRRKLSNFQKINVETSLKGKILKLCVEEELRRAVFILSRQFTFPLRPLNA